VYEQFVQAFSIRIGQIYGASEFGSVYYNAPEISPFDPCSVGRPLNGVETLVLDLDDPTVDMPLPPGTSGEIAIRSPTMFNEYLDSTDCPDASGYLRTGDIGSLDDSGVLRITGRVKLLIDVGAQKVNPLEVEAVLGQHKSVAESIVVATRYSSTANRLKAVVIASDGERPDPDELLTYLRTHLIGYKVPRRIEVREALPRSPAGKVLRNELQAEAFKDGK
jgi:long-chain acyl-CoA synthetase